jgi:hypothetical protein
MSFILANLDQISPEELNQMSQNAIDFRKDPSLPILSFWQIFPRYWVSTGLSGGFPQIRPSFLQMLTRSEALDNELRIFLYLCF